MISFGVRRGFLKINGSFLPGICRFATPTATDLSSEKLIATDKLSKPSEVQKSSTNEQSDDFPPPWEAPWLYALGDPREKRPAEYANYESSKTEFHWVKRLFPARLIPTPPQHQSYPTPSGWIPPKSPPPDLPYFVRRNRFHIFPLTLERRRDDLDTKTLEFNYVELVVLKGIEGDVFACEKDLRTFLEDRLKRKIGTHINEPQGKIRVKGADRSDLEAFLLHTGF